MPISQTQLHLVRAIGPTAGGEGVAATRHVQALAKAGANVVLLASCADATLTPQDEAGQVTVAPWLMVLGPFSMIACYFHLKQTCIDRSINVMHLHGLWSPMLAVAAVVAMRLHIPLVISPHGCLDPLSLKHKFLKKRIALKTYQRYVLKSASLFVVTSQQEAENVRNQGLTQPIAVIPLGIDVPLKQHRVKQGPEKIILFLARLHPNKGLIDLVDAWSQTRQTGWKIVVAGGDEEGFRVVVEARIRKYDLEDDFIFKGHVEGAQKESLFRLADLFVLPTHTENFGIAIAEALAYGLPVITTTGAPWQDLQENQCGWWIKPSVPALAQALTEALNQSPVYLAEMGERGRQLILKKYAAGDMGNNAFEAIEWLLDPNNPLPNFVIPDPNV